MLEYFRSNREVGVWLLTQRFFPFLEMRNYFGGFSSPWNVAQGEGLRKDEKLSGGIFRTRLVF